MRDGISNTYNNNMLTDEEIMVALLQAGTALLPVVISPYVRMGLMFFCFLFGRWAGPHYKFDRWQSLAQKMYNQVMLHPSPSGIIPLATSNRRRKKAPHSFFMAIPTQPPPPTSSSSNSHITNPDMDCIKLYC